MLEPPKNPHLSSNRRRIGSRLSVTESIRTSRTTILVNMIIEISTTLILIFGCVYLTRFLIYFRYRINDLYFNIFLGTILFCSLGWSIYIVIQLRNNYRLFKEAREK